MEAVVIVSHRERRVDVDLRGASGAFATEVYRGGQRVELPGLAGFGVGDQRR